MYKLYSKEEAKEIIGIKMENFSVKENGNYYLFIPKVNDGIAIATAILFDRYTGKYRPFYPPTEPKEILNLFKSR